MSLGSLSVLLCILSDRTSAWSVGRRGAASHTVVFRHLCGRRREGPLISSVRSQQAYRSLTFG